MTQLSIESGRETSGGENLSHFSSEKRHLVIIGGGASGVITLIQTLERSTSPLAVTLVDPSHQLGRGRAYSTSSLLDILNVPAGSMSVFPDKPDDFLNWANENHGVTDPFSFLPRKFFGDYLQTRLKKYEGRYEHRVDLAKTFHRSGGQWKIELHSRASFFADYLVIATGYEGAADASVLKTDDPEVMKKVIHPYDWGRLNGLRPESRVFVLGTGLTAIDVFRQLFERDPPFHSPVNFMSRHGSFPHSHLLSPALEGPPAIESILPPLDGLSPLQIFVFLRAWNEASRQEWSKIADELRRQAQAIWACWDTGERRQFFRHLQSYWNRIRHRAPAGISTEMARAERAGRIRTLAGRIVATEREGEAIQLSVMARGSAKIQKISCDWIILAMELGINHSLLDSSPFGGLGTGVKACPFGKGYINQSAPSLWICGPASKGMYGESTAIPDIVKQAVFIADSIQNGREDPKSLRLWGAHPKSVDETYSEHFMSGIRIAISLLKVCFQITVHAVFPFLYVDRASNELRRIENKLSRRRIKNLH